MRTSGIVHRRWMMGQVSTSRRRAAGRKQCAVPTKRIRIKKPINQLLVHLLKLLIRKRSPAGLVSLTQL